MPRWTLATAACAALVALPFVALPQEGATTEPPATRPASEDVAKRVADLRKSLEGLRSEYETLRKEAGAMAEGAAPLPSPHAPALEGTLPPEKEAEALAAIVEEIRRQVRLLRGDLAFRRASDALAKDLTSRVPPFRRLKPGEAKPETPSVAQPVPPSPQPATPTPTPPTPPVATPTPPTPSPPALPAVEAPKPPEVALSPSALAPGGDRVVLRVDGVEIRKAEIEEYVAYLKTYRKGTDGQLARYALDHALIPVAALRARHRDKVEEMHRRAESLRGEIQAGADFVEVARRNSDDRFTAPNGGDLGTFEREEMKLPFSRRAFLSKAGEVTEPFFSSFGCHLVKIEERLAAVDPAAEKVRARHILVAYDPKDPNPYQTLNKVTDEAKVEVVDPEFRPAVPPRYLRED